jgi:hypothetical protein
MTVTSPITFENALKAYHGKYQWYNDYETLFYGRTLERVTIAKKQNVGEPILIRVCRDEICFYQFNLHPG